MATPETSYTLTEAARVTGKSRVTIRRYLDGGKFPRAYRDEACGETPPPWRVPLSDLTAAGFNVAPADRIAGTRSATQGAAGGMSDAMQQLREQLAVAAALADERGRTIDILVAQVDELRSMLHDALAATSALVTTASDAGRRGGK